LYGFSGLRLQETGLNEAYAPVLPQEWKSMTLKGVAFRGRRYDITVDRDAAGQTRLTRKSLDAQH
jgi:trehalose/maltose hydrolase-like predicted phosphorylase